MAQAVGSQAGALPGARGALVLPRPDGPRDRRPLLRAVPRGGGRHPAHLGVRIHLQAVRLRERVRRRGGCVRVAVRRTRRPLGTREPRRRRPARQRRADRLRRAARAQPTDLHHRARRRLLRGGDGAGRDTGADPRLLAAGRTRHGHGPLGHGPGARQPRGHRDLQPHAGRAPRLAVAVPALWRDRPGRRPRRPAWSARALPGSTRPAHGERQRPRADRGARRRPGRDDWRSRATGARCCASTSSGPPSRSGSS